ncbi:hypothetical protein HYZ64_03985 [Candidatus Berkelbacteria bacterium]|nr:hypothetical protein [Candidatus Berkelbacteria bacterium]
MQEQISTTKRLITVLAYFVPFVFIYVWRKARQHPESVFFNFHFIHSLIVGLVSDSLIFVDDFIVTPLFQNAPGSTLIAAYNVFFFSIEGIALLAAIYYGILALMGKPTLKNANP